MGLKEGFYGIIHRWKPNKYVIYTKVECDVLSTCTSKLEAILKTAGVRFVRLLEPDPETLASYADGLYTGKSIEVIELTDGMSRMFYLVSPSAPIRLKGEFKQEFTLFFNVKSREALKVLLKVIAERRIGGKRFKHRSEMSFIISFLGSFLFSALLNTGNYLLQFLILLILTVLIYLILDYPFSLLYVKGVEVLSHDPFAKRRTKVIKVVRIRKADE